MACRLLTAAAVRLIPATVVRLWFPAPAASAPGQEPSAKEKAAADRRPVACRLLTVAVVRLIQAAVVRLCFQAQPVSVLARDQPAKVQAAADRRPVVCRVSVPCRRAASNREPECLAQWCSEPVPPLERPTAAAKARARQQLRLRQYRQRQCRQHPAMILRRQPEAALPEAAVQQPETAVGMQGTEPAARLSESGRPDWSP